MRVEGEEISAVVRDMDEFSDKYICSRMATTEEALALIIHQYARRVEAAAKRADDMAASMRNALLNCRTRLKSIAAQHSEWRVCVDCHILEIDAALANKEGGNGESQR